MRLLAALVLALASTAVVAHGVHKCEKKDGTIYYTDKPCSTKNKSRVLLHEDASQQPAPEPPQKPQKAPKR